MRAKSPIENNEGSGERRAKGHRKPDYRVIAKSDADVEKSSLIQIGVGYDSETIGKGIKYIWVRLDALPFGKWNGELQIYKINPEESSS